MLQFIKSDFEMNVFHMNSKHIIREIENCSSNSVQITILRNSSQEQSVRLPLYNDFA